MNKLDNLEKALDNLDLVKEIKEFRYGFCSKRGYQFTKNNWSFARNRSRKLFGEETDISTIR